MSQRLPLPAQALEPIERCAAPGTPALPARSARWLHRAAGQSGPARSPPSSAAFFEETWLQLTVSFGAMGTGVAGGGGGADALKLQPI